MWAEREVADMEAPRRTILAVLSADAECVDRVWRLYGDRDVLVLVLASDPDELLRVVVPLTRIPKRAGSNFAGVLVDLTTPLSAIARGAQGSGRPSAEHTVDSAVAAETAIDVVEHLAEVGIGSVVPLIVVSADNTLRTRLDVLGMAHRALLSPSDEDAIWRLTLDILLAPPQESQYHPPHRIQHRTERVIPPATAIPLRDDLWFDAAACELLRPRKRIPLTARESSLLAILLRTPHTYLPASELARRLTLPNAYPVDTHSIEQTISTLRRKLGESKLRPRLLRVRRGVGYGIFPQISEAAQAPTAADTLAKSVEFSRRRRRKT